MKKSADEIRTEITNQIVAAIEKGTPPWRQPWINHPAAGAPRNAVTQRRYTSINFMLLVLIADMKGYKSQLWNTFSAWTKSGFRVKKGEKAATVSFFRPVPKKEKGVPVLDGNGKPVTIPLMRMFPVFNAEQVESPTVEVLLKHYATKAALIEYAGGVLPTKKVPSDKLTKEKIAKAIHDALEEKLNTYKVLVKDVNDDPDFQPAEELIGKCGVKVLANQSKAFYSPKPHEKIGLPAKRSFVSMADYYQTAMHELVHMAVHGKRVEVKDESKLANYAFGELVAEIGSCFILSALGVPSSDKMLKKSESYVGEWLKEMGGNNKYIFDAASIASRAADFLLGLVGKANPPYVESDEEGGEEHERAA